MDRDFSTGKNQLFFKFSLVIGIIVIFVIGGIYFGLLINNKKLIEEEMIVRARSHFDNIILTRFWNASHGGVYVLKTEGMESNPYLENPDIETIDGKIYTLKNPALMTREISEIADSIGSYRFNITSLRPINPANEPDIFEREALQLFEEGLSEFYLRESENGNTYFRYMAPLTTEEACLTCHATQGYNIGDIRGGISVKFDITSTEEVVKKSTLIIILLIIFTSIFVLLIVYFFIFRLNNQLGIALQEIERMAKIDQVTGLYNRHHMFLWIEQEMNRMKRYHHPICFIMIDLDFFKKINDTYGHKAGDQTLRSIAKILMDNTRSTDLVARYGGEEFLVVLVDTKSEGALDYAEIIKKKIAENEIVLSTDEVIKITASFGIFSMSMAKDDEDTVYDIADCIENADTALYRAKETGRNKIVIYKGLTK